MKKIFKASSLLFIFLSTTICFLLGMYLAGILGVAENQGLAGGGIIFGYGLLNAFGALVVSILTLNFLEQKVIVKLNKVLSFLWLLGFGFFSYKFINRDVTQKEHKIIHQNVTASAPRNISDGNGFSTTTAFSNDLSKMGLGLFKPHFVDNDKLYFYGFYGKDRLDFDHPLDSIVFNKNEHGQNEIISAPPWLVPEHLKLDYEILYFKVLEIGKNYYKIVANKINNKLVYVSKNSGEMDHWTNFLLNVNSVEFKDTEARELKIKPLNHAAKVIMEYEFLSPISINGNWMKVKLLDKSYNLLGEAWIKWRDGNKMLIKYAILS